MEARVRIEPVRSITEQHYGKWNAREQERLNARIVTVNEGDEVLAALSKPPVGAVPISFTRTASRARQSA